MPPLHEYYPAKLLLFGEYTVLNGSQALAVPLNQYRGSWIKREMTDPTRKEGMIKYAEWLSQNDLIDKATEKQMNMDAEDGWHFESSIPMGYGIGSSGALVAAMYDRYLSSAADINTIHSIMAQMEGFFHGASSGLDPLVSYTQKAVYKDEKSRFHSVPDPGWPPGYKIYLFDSGMGRETGPFVQQYRQKLLDPGFMQKIERQYIPMVEHAIHFYLAGQHTLLEDCIRVISSFQREYFTEMIPAAVQIKWDEWVSIPGVYVKLCGAGGGGYFMVISTGEQDLSSGRLIRIG